MTDGTSYDVAWLKQWPEKSLPVEQVYGILFDDRDDVLVLNDDDRYFLPGGRPEIGESWTETLSRECLEEAHALIERPLFLGHVHVRERTGEGIRAFAQIRFIAAISELRSERPDPDTGRSYGREFHHPMKVAELLNWGDHGWQQLADAAETWKASSERHRSRCPSVAGTVGDSCSGTGKLATPPPETM